MIYTVTFNPALDYIVRVGQLNIGEVNRTEYGEIMAGGKGVNVSLVLKNLGHESTALGFAAGFTGEKLIQDLKAKGCRTDFIFLDKGMTRINVKIKGQEETEINGEGPEILWLPGFWLGTWKPEIMNMHFRWEFPPEAPAHFQNFWRRGKRHWKYWAEPLNDGRIRHEDCRLAEERKYSFKWKSIR